MFSEFPIDEIKRQTNHIVNSSVPLPSTYKDVTYECCPLGRWTIYSEKWHDDKGDKYSLWIDVDGTWIVQRNRISLCPLKDLTNNISNRKTPQSFSEYKLDDWLGIIVGIPTILFVLFYIFSGSLSRDSEKSDQERQEKEVKCGVLAAESYSRYLQSGCQK